MYNLHSIICICSSECILNVDRMQCIFVMLSSAGASAVRMPNLVVRTPALKRRLVSGPNKPQLHVEDQGILHVYEARVSSLTLGL